MSINSTFKDVESIVYIRRVAESCPKAVLKPRVMLICSSDIDGLNIFWISETKNCFSCDNSPSVWKKDLHIEFKARAAFSYMSWFGCLKFSFNVVKKSYKSV